jgi:hypothetical protein
MKIIKNYLLPGISSILLLILIVTLAYGDSCPDYGHIGDLVWNDLNADGIQDIGEPGIPGVIVNLSFSDNTTYRSTTTDINGNYYFHYVLINREYYVEFILPEGYEFSPQNQGNDDTIDSDAHPITGKTDIFSLSVDEDNNTIDAGMFYCIECKDEIWVDDNYNSTTPGWNIDHVSTIQSGIDKICPYGTVIVHDGYYNEDVIIPGEKFNVLLRGEDIPVEHHNPPIIDGTITIYGDSTTINYLWFNCSASKSIEIHVEGTRIMYNVFDFCCKTDKIAIYAYELVEAEYNWWGAPNGPNGGIMDDGYIAKGYGCQIIGPVYVEPWVGVFAKGKASVYSVEVNESVVFNGYKSFAADFNSTYEPDYYWIFEPSIYSNDKQIAYSFDSPGIYEVSLRVKGNGIVDLHQDFMYNWTYLSIEVTSPVLPLTVNADGNNQDGYQTVIGQPVSLQGRVSGGVQPYIFSWDLGDGNSSIEQNPTYTYKLKGNYTLILTVIDNQGTTATDITTIEVIDNQDISVEIKNIRGNLGFIRTTIVAGETQVNWSISIDGHVFLSNETNGTIPPNVQATVRLPFIFGFGFADVTISASTIVEVRRAFILGPFILLSK